MLRPDILKEYSIYPIKIPTPFAVGDVFSYLIKDEKNVLVDTGQYTDDAFECVRYHLSEQELTIEDIDEIWLTHGHPDHYGQAAQLADRAGATVFGHPLERSNFGGNDVVRFRIPQNLPNGWIIEANVEGMGWNDVSTFINYNPNPNGNNSNGNFSIEYRVKIGRASCRERV